MVTVLAAFLCPEAAAVPFVRTLLTNLVAATALQQRPIRKALVKDIDGQAPFRTLCCSKGCM